MEIQEIPLNRISPSPFQPRALFNKQELQELAASIEENGLINPITLRQNRGGNYQIIAGERRWRAFSLLEKEAIPAIIKDTNDQSQRVLSLIENVHRKDLNMVEKGEGVMEIFRVHGIELTPKELISQIINIGRDLENQRAFTVQNSKINDICVKTGVNRRTIKSWLETLSVDDNIKEIHISTPIEERPSDTVLGRIATIDNPETQRQVYKTIASQGMNQYEASKFVTQIKKLDAVEQNKILSAPLVDLIGDEETGFGFIISDKKDEYEQYVRVVEKPKSIKHVDKIPQSQLYHEKNSWNLHRFSDHIHVFTIGTDGKNLVQFLDLMTTLRETKKLVLVDVRDTPYSRFKPEFNKKILERELGNMGGIDYVHVPDLGVPKNMRKKLFSNQITESELWVHYKEKILTDEQKKKVLEIISPDKVPIFLCTEISPIRCHRHVIAKWLEKEKKLLSWDL